jgi:hypothetical protein
MIVNSSTPFNTASLKEEPGYSQTTLEGSTEDLSVLRELTNKVNPPYRIDAMDPAVELLNAAPITGVPSASGYDPFALKRLMLARLLFASGSRWGATYDIENVKSPVVDLFNIGYAVSRDSSNAKPSISSKWKRVGSLAGRSLYENTTVLPRFYLAQSIQTAEGPEQAASLLKDPLFDSRSYVIVESTEQNRQAPRDLRGSVTLKTYSPNEINLQVDASSSGTLVASEAYYPGWRAWIDDVETRVYPANIAFRAVNVPAGRHRVDFRFRPVLLPVSLVITCLATLLLVALTRKIT